MRWRLHPWDALTARQAYTVLQLRSAVFVLEQQCLYADMDGLDLQALHVLGYAGDALVAYARCWQDEQNCAHIGRVVTASDARGQGLGHDLMRQALVAVASHWPGAPVLLGAQAHLAAFYAQHGFASNGPSYVEDGIPHIPMRRATPTREETTC